MPPGDVLLHGGDFSNVGLPSDVDKFVVFMASQPHPHKVGKGWPLLGLFLWEALERTLFLNQGCGTLVQAFYII